MHIVKAVRRMEDVLAGVDAPRRQLRGVRAWRSEIEWAVAAARPFRVPQGLILDTCPVPVLGRLLPPPWLRFVHGDATHQAWLAMSRKVVEALELQAAHAAGIVAAARTAAVNAGDDAALAAALAAGKAANVWLGNASTAAWTGRDLIRREDAILRPVGLAIAAAGGLREVARDRHYHQMETAR